MSPDARYAAGMSHPLESQPQGVLPGSTPVEILNPPKGLCRSCEGWTPHFMVTKAACCRVGFRPLVDGSCRFYRREPGSDDE